MTLGNHAIIGASAAALLPVYTGHSMIATPIIAFSLGMASHYLFDTIPHWDYDIGSLTKKENDPMAFDIKLNKSFIFDLSKMAVDVFLGLALVYIIFILFQKGEWWPILVGAIGGVTPDFLQFVYTKIRRAPFSWFQKLHNFTHNPNRLHLERPWRGALGQLFFTLVIVAMIVTVFLVKK